MDVYEKIPNNILSGKGTPMKVRKFLLMSGDYEVTGGYGGWYILFHAPGILTADGIARWSSLGVLDMDVIVGNEEAFILGIKDSDIEKSVCSLFNTLEGRVNEYTFRKYVSEKEDVK